MPTFRYESLATTGLNGSPVGVIEAPDRAAALRQLRQRGITPTRLEMGTPSLRGGPGTPELREGRSASTSRLCTLFRPGSGPAQGASRRPDSEGGVTGTLSERGGSRNAARGGVGAGMSRGEMASFIRELGTALQAGLTLPQALKTSAKQGRSARQRAMLGFLLDQIEHGKPLSEAAAAWGRPFSELVISLMRAGEASGKLDDVLAQAADLLERDVKLRRAVLGATTYPLILCGLVSIAIVVMVTIIVPRVLAPVQGQITAADLPLPTRVVSGVADVVGAYWWLLIGGVAGLIFALSRLYAQPGPRLAIDGALIRTPVLGALLRDAAVARFTRTLGTLISAGLPALTALRATRPTLGNRAMEALIAEVCEQVQSGKTIAEPLEKGGLFPPLLIQIVSVGERSGRLPQLLRQAADALEGRTEASLKLFTAVLPPLLILVLASIVGFVIAAILLPLIQMQEYIR